MKKTGWIIAVLALVSCGILMKKEHPLHLSGAGATFPAPFYTIVMKEYSRATGNDVTYGGIGSGGGIRSLHDRTIDFGATDVYVSDADLKEMGGEVIHIPTVVGAIVLSYNLEGIKDLKLTADIISGIYRGTISRWDDPAIRRLNPGLALPGRLITPVYRSDGSGTTAVFSEYMTKADAAWKESIGTGKSLLFPAGIAAKGNPGVAGVIAGTDGAIGYIGSEYALALSLPFALLENRAGRFVKADSHTISASADVDIPSDTRVSITDSSHPDAYPISTFTWIIAYREQQYNGRTREQARALQGLFLYIAGASGQRLAERSYYAPLPAKALEKAEAVIGSMTFNGESIQ